MARLGIQDGLLQGDLNANNKTILNLDLTGLGLTKASVGLGNVDNTSDINKPISNATNAALVLKESVIVAGLSTQFWQGDKTWKTYGSLALEDAVTTKPLISVIGAAANSSAVLSTKRNDYQSSTVSTSIQQLGASVLGNVLSGVPGANVGMLVFEGDSFGVIKTTNSAPIIFGTNSLRRMRLEQGLNVGGDTDPGIGCISANGTVTATNFAGGGSGITGLVKNQIPAILNASSMERLTITGVGGEGYLELAGQSTAPFSSSAKVFANSLGRISLQGSINAFNLSFGTDLLSANRIWTIIDSNGTVPVIVAAPANSASAGKPNSIAFDATHFHYCISSGVWVRCAMATW